MADAKGVSHWSVHDLRQAFDEAAENLHTWPNYLDPEEVRSSVLGMLASVDERLRRLEDLDPEDTP